VRVKYEVYESDHQISSEWWGGYMRRNTIRRRVLNLENQQIADEFVTRNNAIMMYEPLLSVAAMAARA